MKIVEFLPARPNRLWKLARQVGIRHAVCKCAPELTGLAPPWELDTLRTIQQRLGCQMLSFRWCRRERQSLDQWR